MVRLGTVARTLILCGLAMTTLAFAKTDKTKTIVTYPSAFGISQHLSELPIDMSIFFGREMPEPRPGPLRSKAAVGAWQQEDSVLQKEVRPLVSATPGINFDGISSPGYAPSDSNLAIGPNHIVETVNVQFAVYNKSGATLAGPTNILSLFAPLGGDCGSGTSGDPIVLYDRPADRWLISYIGSSGGSGGNTAAECIAVSKTNDPTGSYYLYGYSFGSNLNDYPKLSTWATASNSAYLANYNIFQNFGAFIGAELCGFDRTKMLAGDSTAAQLCQMTPITEGSYLPSDLDGPTTPPDGTPGMYISWQTSSPGQLYLRKLTLNFATATATLSSPTAISVANFTPPCGTCVPQSGTSQTLDTLGDRVMYRFAIRHFADHDRAVVSHAVANGGQVAVRWYELYDPAGSVTLNQQGTFAPDTTYRWMSSIAEDQSGDIGLGYSVSSSSIHPGIRFTGRVPSDPAGTMETEASMLVGAGSQTAGLSRWGDYTAMQVDPADDCTFWYVNQYEKFSGTFNWNTNIGSFAFSTCSGAPDFSLIAAPTAVTITQGSQGTSTITVNPLNGFTGGVTLSTAGLPSGVTGTFTPNPATSTSTLTLAATATAATGTNTVTITGTSGSLTHQTTVSLTVNPGGVPIVSLTKTALTWGGIVLGTTSPAKSVTVTNIGTAALNISSIAISGDFAQTAVANSCGSGSTLAAGKSCVIKVTFTPTQVGLRTGNITITDNAPDSPQTVPLSGTGVPQATLTPSTATYSARKVGTTSPARLFTLTNKQSVALNNIVSSTTGDFTIFTTTCTTSLAAKSFCTISVTFTPTATGTRTGTLSVSDSASNSPQISNLTGTGN